LEKIPHNHKNDKPDRVKFGKIKRGFKSAIDVVSANNSDKSQEKIKHQTIGKSRRSSKSSI
jgi:hypothetical protein